MQLREILLFGKSNRIDQSKGKISVALLTSGNSGKRATTRRIVSIISSSQDVLSR